MNLTSLSKPRGVNLVAIGGGTGLSTLLAGLKRHVNPESALANCKSAPWIDTLTAVVTVTDDGGSSGRLREEFQILPPGDIRNCMVALAEDESLLTRLFQFRFESEGDLSGHSFGNIFLTALTSVTGDFLEAIKLTSEVLAIKGRIFPATIEDVGLWAEFEDGSIVKGESRISAPRASGIKRLWLSGDCKPLPETLEAISRADIITIGPGSLYTSIIPNLLVSGIVEAIERSRALKAYICNVMTQPGETEGFDVDDHIRVLSDYSQGLNLDYVVVNSAPISDALRGKYMAEGAVPVELGARLDWTGGREPSSRERGYRVIPADLINERNVVRHDPDKLARLLMRLYVSTLGTFECDW